MKTAILFDLDGTLVDNFDAIYAAYVHTLGTLGLPPTDYDTVRRTVGGSVPVTMRRLLKEDFTEEAIPIFNQYFKVNFSEGLRLLPGAIELVQKLHATDRYVLGVFTNKNHESSQDVCRYLGLEPYMKIIEGSERLEGFRKPAKAFSEMVLDKIGMPATHTWMIGDSPFDAEAARAVNMARVYLVGTGSHSVEALREETDADGVFASMNELEDSVFDLPALAQTD